MKLTILTFLISTLLFSCSGTKPLMKQREIKNIENAQLLDTLNAYYGDFTSFTARFSGEIITARKSDKKDKSTEVKGSIRIQKDSVIWLSISPLMVEVIRFQFTPDSLYFLNKVDKEYYAGSYDLIKQITGFDINFKSLQSILLNELCMYPFNEMVDTAQEIKSYDIKKKNNEIVLQKQLKRSEKNIETDDNIFEQIYKISINTFRINSMQLNELTKESSFSLDYKEFDTFNSIVFPEEIYFTVKTKSSKFKLQIDYSKVEFNTEQNYPFRISPRYKKWKP